jgi:hypothetical protein
MSERPDGTPEEAAADPIEPAEPTGTNGSGLRFTPDTADDASAAAPDAPIEPQPEPALVEHEPDLVAEPELAEPVPEPAPDDQTQVVPVPPASAAAAAATGAPSTVRRRGAPVAPAPRVATPSERAVRVTDNPSKYFVIAAVGIFVAILLYGLLAGHGGLLTTKPAPNPSASAPASASPAASTSAAPSSSVAPSASAAPSLSATPSVAPSAAPTSSAAASPSPS